LSTSRRGHWRGVKLICGTADRGTAEPVELAEPAEPREMTAFIVTAFGGIRSA